MSWWKPREQIKDLVEGFERSVGEGEMNVPVVAGCGPVDDEAGARPSRASIFAIGLSALVVFLGSYARAELPTPQLVKDLKPGPRGSSPASLVECGGTLAIFTARTSERGFFDRGEIWRTDGTSEGTFHLLTTEGFVTPFACDYSRPDSFYIAETEGSGFVDVLWRTDGTPEGTIELNRGLKFSSAISTAYLDRPGLLLFTAGSKAPSGIAENLEPWVSDGTPKGTHLLSDLRAGEGSRPFHFREFQGKAYFLAQLSSDKTSLVGTDGTLDGTRVVSDASNWRALYAGDPWLYLEGLEPDGTLSLWRSDGTETQILENFGSLDGGGSLRFFGTTSTGLTLWKVITDDTLYSLWASDGTPAGTRKLMNIRPLRYFGDQSISASFEEVGGLAYFIADDGMTDWELWQTDGTPNRTRPSFETCPGTCTEISSPGLDLAGGRLIIEIRDPDLGSEPALTDGTAEGTRVLDICPGTCGSSSRVWLGTRTNLLTFARTSESSPDSHLYSVNPSDGEVRELTPPPQEVNGLPWGPGDFTLLPGRLLFPLDDPTTGTELWSLSIVPASVVEIPTANTASIILLGLIMATIGSILVRRLA